MAAGGLYGPFISYTRLHAAGGDEPYNRSLVFDCAHRLRAVHRSLMLMNRKAVAATAIVILSAASAGAWWWADRNDTDGPQWRTAKITRGTLTAVVSASGTINPVASVSVGSQVSGQIAQVLVDFNSPVKAQQVIARINPETFQQQVRQAQADLDAALAQVMVQQAQVAARRAEVTRAEVNLAEARLDLSRKEQLVERGFISPAERDKSRSVARAIEQDLNSAHAALDVALAQVRNNEAVAKQRQAALAAAQINLERSVIRSPVDGVVIKRSIEPGQTVAASLQAPELFVIAKNLRDMQVDTAIDESDVGRMQMGQRATFTVDAFPGRVFDGTVGQVRKAAQNVQNVVTYNVVVTFQNIEGHLLPGMTANVRIATDARTDVLMVPNAALRFRMPADTSRSQAAAGTGQGSDAAPRGRASGSMAGAAQSGMVQVGPAGSTTAALRERLERELALDATQRSQLDTIFAGMRDKFVALRELPEEQRARAAEANRAELRAKVAAILTPTQQPRFEAIMAESAGRVASGGRGRIYLLQEGAPQALDVRTGISDGAHTEVSAAELTEGADVITGSAALPGSAASPGAGSARRSAGPPRLF